FFFQAEDGIRDRNVTGVQTCALPIFDPDTYASGGARRKARGKATPAATSGGTIIGTAMPTPGTICARLCTTAVTTDTPISIRRRSEERRVGKECRSWGAAV